MKRLITIFSVRIALAVILSLLPPFLFFARAAVSVTDPVGDSYDAAPFTDIVLLEAVQNITNITFKLDFVDLSRGLNGTFLIDTDGNRQSHGSELSYITEARIEFTVVFLGICWAQFYDSDGNDHDLSCWVAGNSFFVDVPLVLLPASMDHVEVAGLVSFDFLCEGRDRIPDEGYMRLSTGVVHIDNEGLILTPLSMLSDPAGDSSSPTDLKGFEVEAVGEHLVIRTHYHHSIEPHDFNEVSIGMLHLDLDGDILTGFQNATGVFPTFGVDAYLYYTLNPRALGGNIEINLTLQDPTRPMETTIIQVGKHSTGSSYRRSNDWIECTIPLGILPSITDAAAVVVQSMSPIRWLFDSFPDSGGVKLTDGSAKGFNVCQSQEVFVTDLPGDSFAFGGDNDDLIAMKACHYIEGVLCTVEYTDLRLIGEGLTAINFDLDRNASTGEPTYNYFGDTLMGIEKSIVYQLSSIQSGRPVGRVDGTGTMTYFGGTGGSGPMFTTILVEGSTGDVIRGINPLFTLNFYSERVYITIPYRLMDDDDGMDARAVTMSGAFGTATFADDIPNSGFFSIPPNQECEGDFEPDGDVDGSDLAVFAADFGRTNCDAEPICAGNFDNDNDVDVSDFAVFTADFGRSDCIE